MGLAYRDLQLDAQLSAARGVVGALHLATHETIRCTACCYLISQTHLDLQFCSFGQNLIFEGKLAGNTEILFLCGLCVDEM